MDAVVPWSTFQTGMNSASKQCVGAGMPAQRRVAKVVNGVSMAWAWSMVRNCGSSSNCTVTAWAPMCGSAQPLPYQEPTRMRPSNLPAASFHTMGV